MPKPLKFNLSYEPIRKDRVGELFTDIRRDSWSRAFKDLTLLVVRIIKKLRSKLRNPASSGAHPLWRFFDKIRKGNRRKPATKHRVAPAMDWKWGLILLLVGIIIGLLQRSSAHALPEQPLKTKSYPAVVKLPETKVVEKTPVTPVEVPKPIIKPAPVVITGGDLPAILLRIRHCESGDNYTSQNTKSTASGAFQIINGTWAGYGGYAHAKDAPPAVQDAKALMIYNSEGTSPWVSSEHCWG